MAAAKRKILLVDDDADLCATLSEQLALHEEFATASAGTGAEALALIERDNFDAILLDVGLPDIDGRDLCKVLRRRNIHTPIVLLTVLDSEADAILGLDLGANDYIAKPFRLGILLARLRAHMRQYELSEDATFTVGPYTFRPAAKLMHHNSKNEDVVLSDKECAILKYLYRVGDATVSCDTLYEEIWDYSAALITHTLQTHVYRLRQKIEENPSDPQILVSEAGGYRLIR